MQRFDHLDGDSMSSSLKGFGVIATGGLGVLVGGLLISEILNLSVSGILAVALLIFVLAGAAAHVLRNM